MSEKMKLDEGMLRAVWASTFGAMVAQGVVPGRSFDEIVKRAREYADDAVRELQRGALEAIAAEQNAFKEGDYLTTQYGMLFEVELVFLELPAAPERVTRMLLDCGEERLEVFTRVSEVGWKGARPWPEGLEPYVLRLTDRRP